MRSASLGSSRRKRKKGRRIFKLLLVLFAILAGALTAAEARYKTLRISEIEIESPALSLTAESVWGGIPEQAERFWPMLWIKKRGYESAIERRHPVRAELRFKSWGRYKLDIVYLRPLFKLYWENKYWYVSSEGKMWSASLPDNNMADMSEVLRRPVLAWGKERTSPIDIENANDGVHRSSLPASLIKAWYDNIEFLEWTEKIKSIQTGKREGFRVVRLVFNDGGGGDGVGILFPDDPELWRESGLAVKKIFPDITKISPAIFIDTTYKGKIIVSNRVK